MISQVPEIISPSWDILDKISQLGVLFRGFGIKKVPSWDVLSQFFSLGFYFIEISLFKILSIR
jgi:hypothetical protein